MGIDRGEESRSAGGGIRLVANMILENPCLCSKNGVQTLELGSKLCAKELQVSARSLCVKALHARF